VTSGSWNNMFVNCKSFFAGTVNEGSTWGTTQCGFEISTTQNNSFVNCSAQSNALHGFDLQSNQYVTVTGCESDSNGAGVAAGANAAGINLNGNTNCSIVSNTGNVQGTANQVYGVAVAGTQTGTWLALNNVKGTSSSFGYISGGGYILMDPSVVDFGGVSQFKSNGVISFSDLDIQTAGAGLKVAEGTNAKQGIATLTAGSVVVSNTSVTASSRIQLTAQDNSTTGALRVSARTAGTSFTITSSNAGDSGVVAYEIFEPG